MQLRLTRRALEDLGLDVEVHRRMPVTQYKNAHPVVQAFVDMRSQTVEGQERTVLPATDVVVWNLHAGRYRGLTWHDEEVGVVWLLGVGWHESGSRDDAYVELKARDTAGRLMPSQEDYLDFEASPDENLDFVTRVAEEAPALMAQARSQPGIEVRATIATRIGIALVIDVLLIPGEDETLEEIWIGFAMPPQEGEVQLPPQPEWITIVIAALLPLGASLDHVRYGAGFPHRRAQPNEIVVHWNSP